MYSQTNRTNRDFRFEISAIQQQYNDNLGFINIATCLCFRISNVTSLHSQGFKVCITSKTDLCEEINCFSPQTSKFLVLIFYISRRRTCPELQSDDSCKTTSSTEASLCPLTWLRWTTGCLFTVSALPSLHSSLARDIHPIVDPASLWTHTEDVLECKCPPLQIQWMWPGIHLVSGVFLSHTFFFL